MILSYEVTSNQTAPHPNTQLLATKHASTNYSRPFAKSQTDAFESADAFVKKQNRPIVLDSGCGTGDSTIWLAKKFTDHLVIGIDQSIFRLTKAEKKHQHENLSNLFFVRARLEDFWRLAQLSGWNITNHYIFYPNPWPKLEHLSRRWHGHPVFPTLLSLSDHLEIRSNWLIYLQEFSLATNAVKGKHSAPRLLENPEGVSAFEKKYQSQRCPCYALQFSFDGK